MKSEWQLLRSFKFLCRCHSQCPHALIYTVNGIKQIVGASDGSHEPHHLLYHTSFEQERKPRAKSTEMHDMLTILHRHVVQVYILHHVGDVKSSDDSYRPTFIVDIRFKPLAKEGEITELDSRESNLMVGSYAARTVS